MQSIKGDKMKLVFVDIETTHLNPAIGEIIEISMIRCQDNIEIRYTTKIKPQRIHHADPGALKVNGYNPEEWQDAPEAKYVAQKISSFMMNAHPVGHNVSFDVEYLREFCHQNGVPYLASRKKIDTVVLSMEHLPFLPSHSLSTLRAFFGLSLIGAHRAEKDCEDMRWIYNRLNRASAFSRLLWRLKYWYIKNKKTLS